MKHYSIFLKLIKRNQLSIWYCGAASNDETTPKSQYNELCFTDLVLLAYTN
jgi:hypothetical protein